MTSVTNSTIRWICPRGRMCDATPAKTAELNPAAAADTPREGTFELHLPRGTKDQYQTAIAAIRVTCGSGGVTTKLSQAIPLASLGRSYRVTAKSIATVNQLRRHGTRGGRRSDHPGRAGKHPVSDTAAYARRITRYRVHTGDTVETSPRTSASPLRWSAAGMACTAETACAEGKCWPCTCRLRPAVKGPQPSPSRPDTETQAQHKKDRPKPPATKGSRRQVIEGGKP